MKTITIEIPDELHEMLEEAELLARENLIMFFTTGLSQQLERHPEMRLYVHNRGVDPQMLYEATEEYHGDVVEQFLRSQMQ